MSSDVAAPAVGIAFCSAAVLTAAISNVSADLMLHNISAALPANSLWRPRGANTKSPPLRVNFLTLSVLSGQHRARCCQPVVQPDAYYVARFSVERSLIEERCQPKLPTKNECGNAARQAETDLLLNKYAFLDVRATVNIQNANLMLDSSTSKATAMTQSFHIEQMVTNQVLLSTARTLLALCLVAFGSALQLLIFAIICLFYDGCPYYFAVFASVLFMLNAAFVLYFIRYKPTRIFLLLCILSSSACFIISVALFIWTAYLVYGEDKQIRGQGWYFYEENLLETNRIVTNTRIAMYSLHMVLTPIQALCCAGILWILYRNLRSLQDERITRGYFFSEPPIGHQTVLVPIELKQVEALDDSEPDNASIGVQTSGNQSNKETVWS